MLVRSEILPGDRLRTFAAPAHPPRQEDDLRPAVPDRRSQHVPFDRQSRGAPLRAFISAAGDIHVHTFGTATLSFAAGITPKAGDVFEIEAKEFGLPLINPLAAGAKEKVVVQAL
jgi:hypothetical protein